MAGFSIFKRPRKNGKPIFYAQFKTPARHAAAVD